MLALVRKMLERAKADGLPPEHPMRVRAKALHEAYVGRFLVMPCDCSVPHYCDCFKRAYAEWHVYTGEES